jgi:CheY-like chemotaxis protein
VPFAPHVSRMYKASHRAQPDIHPVCNVRALGGRDRAARDGRQNATWAFPGSLALELEAAAKVAVARDTPRQSSQPEISCWLLTLSAEINVNVSLNICHSEGRLAEAICMPGTAMGRILLVEDDADVERIVSEFLATLGHFVISASSAQQARFVVASEPVDLALIDCLMKGEQGDSLAEYVSQLGIPTILTSGDPHYLKTIGGQDLPFLAKPFRLVTLEELISRILQ